MDFNTLWIGDSLTTLESMALTSHLNQGHRINLWSYNEVKNVPAGVYLKNAREIMPESDVFAYQTGKGAGSYSACSNVFRYKLLFERGGWWVDTDMVALKPFAFESEFVFASEATLNKTSVLATCTIKAPAQSEIMRYCMEESQKANRTTLKWSAIGPTLMQAAVKKFSMQEFVMPSNTFCPVDWFAAEIDPVISKPPDLSNSYGVHLWHEMWRRKGIDKDGSYDPNCLYEKLKRDAFRQ
jgi:hypothetical protein